MTKKSPEIPEFVIGTDELRDAELLAQKIDLSDSVLCLTYGTEGQMKLSDISDKLLGLVENDNSADASNRINELCIQLNEASQVKERRGLFRLIFKSRDRKKLRERYKDAAEKADALSAELETIRNRLLRDFVMLGKLYDAISYQQRELTVLIKAGQIVLEREADNELKERFGKRLHDLKLSRMVSMQTMTQITILLECNTALSEKIQSLLTNTIALWKNQTAAALAIDSTADAIRELRNADGELMENLSDITAANKEHNDRLRIQKGDNYAQR